jgi:gluconolactonase
MFGVENYVNIKNVAVFIAVCTCILLSCAAMHSPDLQDWDFSNPAVLASGFNHPEAPMLDRDGNLYIVEYRTTVVSKITPDGTVSPVVDTGYLNNGLLFDPEGNLYILCWTGKRILRYDIDGELSLVTALSDGDSLRGPNDIAWGPGGRIYFTDPHGTNEKNPVGAVHYIDQDGATKTFAGGLAYPNGLVFNRDKTYLYVGDNRRFRILRYTLDSDGSNAGHEVFYQFETGISPDGMKFDINGNLWAALWSRGELCCISPDGEMIRSIPLPGEDPRPTNILFGGPDMRTAYVTVRDGTDKGYVLVFDMPVQGLPVIPKQSAGAK